LKPNLKIVTPELAPAREDLRLAILEVEAAEAAAAKGQADVDRASAHLREKERAHFTATSALEEAGAPRKTLAEKLAAAHGEEEKWAAIEEHKAEAGRPPITVDDLRKLRAAVQSAGDEVVAARAALEVAQHRAGPVASVLRRAQERRQGAVSEVARPQVTRLVAECQGIIELLLAKRAELNFASSSLVDSYADERRRAFNFLNCMTFPEEGGLRTDTDLSRRNAALAAWTQFADRITQDASAEFPTA
jgi:hypothetical protein